MGLSFLTRNNSCGTGATSNNNSPSESAVIKLLQAKISQLEDELEKKNSVIQDLQRSCLDKLDSDFTERTEDSLSDSTGSADSGDSNTSTTTSTTKHDYVVEQLTNQLEDRTLTIANLENKLREKSLLTTHLQERLNVAEQAKQTLVAHVTSLEKKIFDQENEIECLQDLNETNSQIVSEMENPNQWRMYHKLQSLMDTNNKLSQQLARTTVQKQEALTKVSNLEKEQLNLYEQMNALKDLIKDQKHKLDRMNVEIQSNFEFTGIEQDDQDHSNSVLPEIQQVIDIFNSSSQSLDLESAEDASTNNSHKNSTDDPKLLHISLLNCQAQLKQMQRNHELQLQKTVRQSVQLAESKATVDTLAAKVEHYESFMDDIIAKHNNSSKVNSASTSNAAKQLMATNDLGPSLEFGAAPPNVYSVRNNVTANRMSLPLFMNRPVPRATLVRQESEYIDFEDMEEADACSVEGLESSP